MKPNPEPLLRRRLPRRRSRQSRARVQTEEPALLLLLLSFSSCTSGGLPLNFLKNFFGQKHYEIPAHEHNNGGGY
jgi:hypothetical protein